MFAKCFSIGVLPKVGTAIWHVGIINPNYFASTFDFPSI